MTIEIKHRVTGRVLYTTVAETLRDANLRYANLSYVYLSYVYLRGADLSYADLSYVYLSYANLSYVYLRGADLSGADLSGANLGYADLSGADLSGADLSYANLGYADLSGADLSYVYLRGADLRDVPVVPNIDAAILAAIEAGGKLNMDNWHTCATTHCRAGWAITLAGEAGAALEQKVGPNAAGALIYTASRPGKRVPDFMALDGDAMDDIRKCAAEYASKEGT